MRSFKLDIILKTLCRESASIDFKCVSGLRKEQLKSLLDKFELKDVFKTDETGLYYKILPGKSIVMKDESGHGVKRKRKKV